MISGRKSLPVPAAALRTAFFFDGVNGGSLHRESGDARLAIFHQFLPKMWDLW